MVKPRFAWLDLAKGICICLVVFGHSNLWFQRSFPAASPTVWQELVLLFSSLRMPLFFLISGFLASSAVAKSFRNNFPKTGGLYILYVFWESVLLLRPLLSGSEHVGGLEDIPLIFLLMPGTLWFIWALPVYYLAAIAANRLLGRKAAWVVVGILFLVAAATPFAFANMSILQEGVLGQTKLQAVLINAVWFFCGIYGRDLWIDLIEKANTTKLALGLAGFVTAYGVLRALHLSVLAVPELAPLALFAAAQVLGLADTDARLSRLFRWIGRQTLQIYVLHLLFISLLNKVVKVTGLGDYIIAHLQLMSVVAPLTLMPVLIATCLLTGRAILASPLKFLLIPMKMPGLRSSRSETSSASA